MNDVFEVLNLDAMSTSELSAQAERYAGQHTPISDDVFHLLSRYCYLKAAAISERKAGDIPAAMTLERWLQRIYEELPSGVRW